MRHTPFRDSSQKGSSNIKYFGEKMLMLFQKSICLRIFLSYPSEEIPFY